MGRSLHAESHYRAYPLDTHRVVTAIREILSTSGRTCLFLAENAKGELAGMLSARIANLFYFDRLVDRTLNGYYRAAMELTKNQVALRKEQLAWLKQRNACDTRHCIVRTNHRRILESALVPASGKPAVVGLAHAPAESGRQA